MKRAVPASAGNDLRLWAAAIATLAILLQTLLFGFIDSGDAMAATMHHGAAAHDVSHGPAKQHDGASCPLSCCNCHVSVAADAPSPLGINLPGTASVATARRRPTPFAPNNLRARTHSARGPPCLA